MSIPNLITLARIILVPVVVWAIASGQLRLAFLLFLAAAVSDAVDGFLAKRFGMKTELGAYLDPLADKVLIVSIYVTLGITGVSSGAISGAPAASTIGVASTVDSYQLRDGLKVNAPSGVAGITAGQMSVAYDWPGNGPTHAPVTGDVATIPGTNADGCQPFSPLHELDHVAFQQCQRLLGQDDLIPFHLPQTVNFDAGGLAGVTVLLFQRKNFAPIGATVADGLL